jgi:gas vesicle protein
MAMVEDMKRFTEDMIAASQTRLRAVGGLVTQTQQTLKRFRSDRGKMAATQAKDLAGFTDELSKSVKEIRRRAQSTIKEFDKAGRQMGKEQSKRLADYVQGLSEDVRSMLNQFDSQRDHMSKEMTTRLEREIADIKGAVDQIVKDTACFINEQHAGMAKARQAWRNMTTTCHRARRAGSAAPTVKAEPKARPARRAARKPVPSAAKGTPKKKAAKR